MTPFPGNDGWPVDPARIDRNWRAITVELDAPIPGRMERLLRRVGLPAEVTRLVLATPALRRSWFVATALAILIGLASADAASPRENLFVLLVVGPLIPVMGVALAYGIEADPAHEIALATPMRGLRLLLTRTAAVLGFSLFWLALAALAAPGAQLMAFAWLLPSLGLTGATLAIMTFQPPRRAGTAVAVAWVLGVSVARSGATDPLAAFGPAGQVSMVLVMAGSLAVVVARRHRFDLLELAA